MKIADVANTTGKLMIVAAILFVYAHAQQPKPQRQPITLSPEASQQWTTWSLQIQNLQLQQQVLVLKAHVPEDYQLAGRDGQGRLVWVAPEPKEAVTIASPSPAKTP